MKSRAHVFSRRESWARGRIFSFIVEITMYYEG